VRRLIAFVVVAVFASLLLAAPVLAAGPWKVTKKSGAVVGRVLVADGYGQIYTKNGTHRGNVVPEGNGYWRVGYQVNGEPWDAAIFRNSGQWSCVRDSSYPNKLLACCVKKGSRWALKRRVNGKWVVRGYVSAKCPGWLAVGGDFRLLR
jgi:hypothetical protein